MTPRLTGKIGGDLVGDAKFSSYASKSLNRVLFGSQIAQREEFNSQFATISACYLANLVTVFVILSGRATVSALCGPLRWIAAQGTLQTLLALSNIVTFLLTYIASLSWSLRHSVKRGPVLSACKRPCLAHQGGILSVVHSAVDAEAITPVRDALVARGVSLPLFTQAIEARGRVTAVSILAIVLTTVEQVSAGCSMSSAGKGAWGHLNSIERQEVCRRFQLSAAQLRAILSVIIPVFLVSWNATAYAKEIMMNDKLSVPSFFAVPSLDIAPVEIEMQGIRWRVPRNFLETAEFSDRSDDPAKRIKSLTLRIVTNLSTLQGATKETLKCYQTLRADVCPDTIMMLTDWGGVESSRWNQAAIVEAAHGKNNDVFGLTKVNTKVSLGPQEVFVFYGSPPEKSVVIQCVEIGGGGLTECTVRLEADGVPMSYSFSKKQLPHWRKIHGGVTALLKSFRVEGGK